MKRITGILFIALLQALIVTPAAAQSLEQRIAHVRAKQRQERLQAQAAQHRAQARITAHLTQRFDEVTLDEVPARQAFEWWTQRARVPLIIDWESMELEGIDADRPISLKVKHLRAGHVLRLIMYQTAPHTRLVHHFTPWYVEVMPRRVANQRTTVRVYDVADLVMSIPHFTDAPDLSLNNGRNGDSEGNGFGFDNGGNNGSDDDDATPTRDENGKALAQLVREVIEPDIWAETAGGDSHIRYFDGRLVVRAPHYVHRQIGVPVGGWRSAIDR